MKFVKILSIRFISHLIFMEMVAYLHKDNSRKYLCSRISLTNLSFLIGVMKIQPQIVKLLFLYGHRLKNMTKKNLQDLQLYLYLMNVAILDRESFTCLSGLMCCLIFNNHRQRQDLQTMKMQKQSILLLLNYKSLKTNPLLIKRLKNL